MLFAVLFFLMGCRPSLIFLPTVPGAGDGGNRTYTVETSEALASAVANAKNGDSIVLENLILSPDWDKLPLKLTSNVKISGNLSISKDSSQIANLAKFKSRVFSEDAIHIFEIDDNVLVSFEEFNVTVSDSAKEFVKAIIHVNKGNTTFSQISMSSDTVLVELGVEASSESVSGSIDGIVIEIVPENPSAFEIAQEIADKTNAKPSIGGESFSVANISQGSGYGTLAEAVKEATDNDIIKLIDDIVLDSRIAITDKTLTIDLNGKTISGSESMKSSSGMILVDNEGNLIIDDTSEEKTGTIDGSSSLDGEYYRIYSALTVWPDDGHKASLTIRNGNIIGDYYAIAGQGTVTAQDSTSIVVENGYLKSNDGAAIYHPQNGSLTIHDGILVGDDTAIEIRAGNLTINGGDFTAIRTPTETKPNGSGTTTVGSAIAVVQHTSKLSISVNISGGVFNAYTPIFESNTQNNPDIKDQIELKISGGSFLVTRNGVESINCEDCEGFITGGEFSLEPAAKYIATGYSAVHSGSSWIVQAN